MIVALLAVLSLSQTLPQTSGDPCAYDRDALLSLTPAAFDLDLDGGWRPLAGIEGCKAAAADLLEAYRDTNRTTMTLDDLHTNYWHEGQLRAALDERDRAVLLLLAGVNPNSPSTAFAEYALGTVAFLNNDRPALEAARTRLAAVPSPEGFAEAKIEAKRKYGMDLVWPINLDVLDGLIACFGEPYDKAYGECRSEVGQTP